jgi:hypothetical protein
MRSKNVPQIETEIIIEAFSVLHEEVYREERIKKALRSKNKEFTPLNWQGVDLDRVYSHNEIKKLCIHFRLRFLDSRQFKNEIPFEAITLLKQLENQLGTELNRHFIVAPSEAFTLEDCDKDPLLFIQVSDKYFYLVHAWGNDLEWFRKWVMFPLRSFTTLGLSMGVVSLILALALPIEFFVNDLNQSTGFARFAFFAWNFVSMSAIVTYIGFAFFKNVSFNQWNSPFFKQEF